MHKWFECNSLNSNYTPNPLWNYETSSRQEYRHLWEELASPVDKNQPTRVRVFYLAPKAVSSTRIELRYSSEFYERDG